MWKEKEKERKLLSRLLVTLDFHSVDRNYFFISNGGLERKEEKEKEKERSETKRNEEKIGKSTKKEKKLNVEI